VQCWLTKKATPVYANNQHDHTAKQKLYVSSAVAVDTEPTRKALPQRQTMPMKSYMPDKIMQVVHNIKTSYTKKQ